MRRKKIQQTGKSILNLSSEHINIRNRKLRFKTVRIVSRG